MALCTTFRRSFSTSALLVASVSVLSIAGADPISAEIIRLSDLQNGITMTPAQCAALPSAVWVSVKNRSFCMRYFLSTAGGDGSRPVVYLSGDKIGTLNMKTGAWTSSADDKDIDTEDLAKNSVRLSRQARTTGIHLSRVGLDGSSGDHRIRRSVLELQATNAALDAIKRRHRFEGFHIVGQSGGSKLLGGLVALRDDIGCAVIGAGRLADKAGPPPAFDPTLENFNVADSISTIARRRSTRIVVITDPVDQRVPGRTQTGFVQMLRQAGGQAEQIEVQATDQNRHGVATYARAALADCVRGAAPQEIAENVRKLVDQRTLEARQKNDPRNNPNAKQLQPVKPKLGRG
jgi:hypothetical protein